jgi:hypothetical protein
MLIAAAVAAASIQAAVAPVAPTRDGLVRVTVSGLRAPAADVVIHGGIASGGKMFGLVPLRDLGNGSWWTELRAPGFLGVYPIRVRAQGVYHDTGALVQVLPRSFAAEPGVNTPAQAVVWWRRQAPAGATVLSEQPWNAGFYFHRDQRYNRLVRVTFRLAGPWRAYHLAARTYTRWFNIARTSLAPGSWKLVQVVDAP